MFRAFVITAVAATSLLTATAAQAQRFYQPIPEDLFRTDWIGVAASPNGRVFESIRGDEVMARSAAKYACEQATGRTCVAIAVPTTWDVVVMNCSRPGQSPLPFVGGSGENAADEVALKKAQRAGVDPNRCKEIYWY